MACESDMSTAATTPHACTFSRAHAQKNKGNSEDNIEEGDLESLRLPDLCYKVVYSWLACPLVATVISFDHNQTDSIPKRSRI